MNCIQLITLIALNITLSLHFEVYWNVPSNFCYRRKIYIPLEEYGIKVNKNNEFYGEKILTLYESKIGFFPYFKNTSDPRSAVNGGIPQKIDLVAHLRKIRSDIKSAIPDSGFNGLAIFDIENWRPLWSLNWGSKRIYKSESIKYVKKRYPKLSAKGARSIAVSEFNKATSTIMVQTIRTAILMRPYAKWGFYGFPYCNYDAGAHGETECKKSFQESNNKILSILNEAKALYPSIYLWKKKNDANFRYVGAILKESLRILKKFPKSMPIFAYSRIEYQPYVNPKSFYAERDLCNSLKQSSDLGINGAIIWSTSNGMNEFRCRLLSNYVVKRFGPYVKDLIFRSSECSYVNCLGRGKCVLQNMTSCTSYNKPREYDCSCDHLYTGEHCQNHIYFPWLFRNVFTSEMLN